jgi:membrane protease YdiL (CAAX protease family)
LAQASRETFINDYLSEGRSLSLNFFFILPLLLLYEVGILLTGSDLRNSAEVILKDLRLLMGPFWTRWFHWFLIAFVVVVFIRAFSKEKPLFRYYILMILESLLIALLLGPILAVFVGSVLLDFPITGAEPSALSVRFLLSVGAGVYEELLFRFFILGGLFYLFVRVFRAPFSYAAALAVLISALFFSLYHHLGPYGQPMDAYPVLFRFGAGIILGAVFVMRGLGVAVYLHVFYDLLRDLEVMVRN